MADWRDRIQVGDILRTAHKTERVVRAIKYIDGKLFCVCFAIMRCSWTTRCYTVYTRHDLATFTPTGKRYRAKTRLDARIHREIEGSFMPAKIKTHCCDVVGVVR